MRDFLGVKPQDVMIAIKFKISGKVSQLTVSKDLRISPGEINHGIKRLKLARIMNQDGSIVTDALIEYLVHGLKYNAPGIKGALTVGMPTAHSNPSFNFVRYDRADKEAVFVWASPNGKVKGVGINPIYKSAPEAAKDDPKLYRILSLIDMIRVGKSREVAVAGRELSKELNYE